MRQTSMTPLPKLNTHDAALSQHGVQAEETQHGGAYNKIIQNGGTSHQEGYYHTPERIGHTGLGVGAYLHTTCKPFEGHDTPENDGPL